MTSLKILRIRKEDPHECRSADPIVRAHLQCWRNHLEAGEYDHGISKQFPQRLRNGVWCRLSHRL